MRKRDAPAVTVAARLPVTVFLIGIGRFFVVVIGFPSVIVTLIVIGCFFVVVVVIATLIVIGCFSVFVLAPTMPMRMPLRPPITSDAPRHRDHQRCPCNPRPPFGRISQPPHRKPPACALTSMTADRASQARSIA